MKIADSIINTLNDDYMFFPAMGRCFDCGRFMKRGLVNWMDHVYGDCPKAEYNKGFRDGIIRYAEIKFIKPFAQSKKLLNP